MIGLSTTYYAIQGDSVYESVKKVTELGFNTIEIGAAHGFEENIWDVLKKIRKNFRHIDFTIHTLFPPFKNKIWFNPADGLNEVNKEIIDNLFTAACILNTSLVSIHPAVFNEIGLGNKVEGNFDKPIVGRPKDRKEGIQKFNNFMNYASEKAVSSGLKLLIENLDTTFANSYPSTESDFSKIFNAFPNTGLLLDIGHAFDCGNLIDMLTLEGYVYEIHLHSGNRTSGNITNRHGSIKDITYFEPLKKLAANDDVVFLFEHGSDVSEEDIVIEKKLLEKFKNNLMNSQKTGEKH